MVLAVGSAVAQQADVAEEAAEMPELLWEHRDESDQWNRAALSALRSHGMPLVEETPDDIARWCPAYEDGTDEDRRAFWVGFLSALAKYESTWRPDAVGGGDQWFGLLQIGIPTAREFGCRGRSGSALMDGATNLSCAIRILAETVPRDGVISAEEARWQGVAADWAPLRSEEKREEMRSWLVEQEYCQEG
ncbi:transglycosylase-like protein with SLT domain [Palleronia aestuarii]|uniref:Transglycosylase-like protein with SLT domain n=2 Tax=Palleronia aestuarii TaxID=568105 RepID=A0A2W7NHV1_9RHOB|nr:transglycosylase-like protein with SLT domain [Palleronia aestuarii]